MNFGRMGAGFGRMGGPGGRLWGPTQLVTNKFRNGGMTDIANTHTWTVVAAQEAEFDYVSVVFGNDRNTSYDIEGLAVAPSAKRNDDINPLTAADAAVSFTTVTFNNAGAFTTLGGQASGATTTITVPAASDGPSSPNPELVASDWVACSSLARADSGQTLPLLFIRYKPTTAAFGRGPAASANDVFTDAAKWPAVAQGRVIRVQSKAVNWFTSPGTYVSPFQERGPLPIMGIRTLSRFRGHSLYTAGDSLTQGLNTNTNANSYGFQACCLVSTAAKPVGFINGGWQGQTMTQIYNRALREIDLFRPSIVSIPWMSVNGAPTTQADHDAMMAQFDALVLFARQKGARPIAVTYPPFNLSTARDALRVAGNVALRARAASGEFPLIDYDLVVSDGATPAKMKVEYQSADFVHTNDAGHTAVAVDEAAPVLSALI